ncbi:NAD(+) synthase [Clostridium estertheticum]|uniref:NAD(+) synthase n=1 Tax=Clostridium estertheticum TaxID=238834 RepID=UPI001C0BDA93|nr:NAD(+) synthase [Clostridium estertheticum]MBU3216515.1 NAD(+) synthase [Clostridium estertheticum]WAG54459.1 NAD(+) synthase [Clostridium estertheticum]
MSDKFGFVKVATGSFDVTVGNPTANSKEIINIRRQAVKERVEVLLFPELALTGYTCGDLFLQSYLTKMTEAALQEILKDGQKHNNKIITIIGLPLRQRGMLFNVAAIIQGSKILGVVPKSYLPNHSEYYEKRWFSPASSRTENTVMLCGQKVPFTPDLIVEAPNGIRLACEICEDLWVNNPPSSNHTMYGANLIVNPSASNEVATKSQYRRDLVRIQSARCMCAYLYASSGLGESTTDLVFSGHNIIAYNGSIKAEEKYGTGLLTTILDIEKLENDRVKFISFSQGIEGASDSRRKYIIVEAEEIVSEEVSPDYVDPFPFVPNDKRKEERCKEILYLQARGLSERLKKIGIQKTVIGISGGLDSTLALLVAADAHKMIGLPLENIIGITMPGFGTSEKTKTNSNRLMELMGITYSTIDIKASCLQHFEDIGHSSDCYDVTYENVQARERTQILMDVANMENALVIGTGDLSELALGWSTYNGDHMSMYAVNSGVPKTLVKYLVSTYGHINPELNEVLDSICNTTISPELLPIEKGEHIQSTEGTIGKYDLHDFFLYHFIRNGFSKEKILKLAYIAFKNVMHVEIDKTLDIFFERFFSQQFKRSCLPDGPKVGTVSLSPRGDWRMPSDVKYPHQ